MKRLLTLAALTLAVACKRSGEPARVAAAAEAPPPAAVVAFVSTATVLRREASEAPRAKGPGGKEISNQLALLQRGERVTLLEPRDEYARVRASDDREGWVRRSALLEGEGITEATVLVSTDVFDRPDLLAANAKRKIEPGTLLLVVKARAPFSEVSASGGPNAWVLSERLATAEKDVSVAKLAEKARYLRRSGKDEEARQILALAREHFPGALAEALAMELGEAPAQDAVVVPVSGERPAGTTQ
jgi:SH3-like domain-containing protein